MCCKCYSPILTLKGNICLLEMTIGRLMIALLPVHLCSTMVLCRKRHPCQIMHPLVEIATWLPNPNPTPNPNPSSTPTPKPTNTRGCIIWQGVEFGTTPGKARVFTKHKQVIISTLCPTGMGVAGVDVVLVSIGELLLSDDRPDYVVCSDHTRSKGRRQTVQVQSVWGRSVRCAMQWEVPYSQEL